MFPTACIFAACGKNGGYNLSKLSNDYYSIAESDGDNIIKQNNSILFDYSKHEQDGEKFLTKIINTVKPYSSINDYNKIYYNLMEFSNAYINACSNNNVGVEKDVKNSLKSKLDGLNSALKDVNIGIDLLANILEITPQDEVSTNISCLQRLEFVISSYESLFKNAIDFTY